MKHSWIVWALALGLCGCPSPNGGSQRSGGGGDAVMVAPDEEFTTTQSGLRYRDLKPGEGPAAAAGQQVAVHYTGWLLDGTQFDSSRDRNQAFLFKLGAGAVIKGWDEGVAGMQAGGQRKLVIPPELGYGPSGVGPIPGNSTLVFEVELLEIR